MKRTLSAVLLLAMLVSVFTACTGGDDEVTDTAAPIETEEAVDESLRLGLPKDLNYEDSSNNHLVVLNAEGIVHGYNDEEASVISKAIYEQFAMTGERLGVTFEFIDVNPFAQLSGLVSQSVNAQSDDYQLVFGVASNINGLVNEGYFLQLSELPYVDLDRVWWNKGYIESVSLNANYPYILFGDITYNTIQRTTCMFFNKRLMEVHHGLTDTDVYNMVLDGDWTVDKFYELATGMYVDNGNNVNDMDDLHGITISGAREVEYVAYSCGLSYTTRDEDGYPVLNLKTPEAVELADKLVAIFCGEDTFAKGGNNDYADLKFAAGKALFMPSRFFLAGWESLRQMEDDFGIIPMPKLDADDTQYYSTVGNAVQWGVVPVTVEDPTLISAVAESLAYEGYHRVTPAYYETSLKLKYTRGDADVESRIIDMITQGARTDFLYMNRLGGIGDIFGAAYNGKQNNFSSYYAQREAGANYNIKNMIAMLENAIN